MAACQGVIRLGDEVTSLEFLVEDCKPDGTKEIVDITDATDLTIRFQRIDGSEETKPGVVFAGGINGNGTDGIVQYVTEPGFITAADVDDSGKGILKGIAIVTFLNAGPFHSSPGKFTVKDNFK